MCDLRPGIQVLGLRLRLHGDWVWSQHEHQTETLEMGSAIKGASECAERGVLFCSVHWRGLYPAVLVDIIQWALLFVLGDCASPFVGLPCSL